jgi:hypothetical protein
MSLIKSLYLLALCIVIGTLSAGSGFCAEEMQWDVAVGPGLNIDGIATNQILIAPALSLQSQKPWLRYRFEGALELIDNDGQITAVAGAAPFLRFDLLSGKRKPFFEIGAGLNVISRNHIDRKDTGGAFIFSVMAGAGYEFTLYERPVAVSCRFRHLSNACLYPHNESLNNVYLLFSIGL